MNNKSVLGNFMWRFFERCGAQGVTFIVSIVLARILEPEAYGMIAMVNVFIVLLNVFVDSGMGNALIQKKNADDLDFSSVFYFNILMCLTLYVLMFFIAPFIASFYAMPGLTPVIRVLSFTLIISGVKNIQQAYVARNMLFKRFFFATLGGTIGAAVIGIWMAYRGWGIWALVAQSLLNATIDTLILWITVKWRPVWRFSINRLKSLFSYGWKLLMASLVYTGYINLRSLIIGKLYTSGDLAFYHRGEQFPHLILININVSLDSVLFPVMSQRQKEPEYLRDMVSRAIKIGMYVMAPLMIGLAVCAEPLVRLTLTEKWLPCTFYLRVACVSSMFIPISTAHTTAIQAIRSDIILKLQLIKRGLDIVVLFATMWISMKAIACGLLFTVLTNPIINALPSKKLFDYSYIDLLRDIIPPIHLAILMGVSIYPIAFLGLSDFATLMVQIVLGAMIYISGSRILNLEGYKYIHGIMTGYISKRSEK